MKQIINVSKAREIAFDKARKFAWKNSKLNLEFKINSDESAVEGHPIYRMPGHYYPYISYHGDKYKVNFDGKTKTFMVKHTLLTPCEAGLLIKEATYQYNKAVQALAVFCGRTQESDFASELENILKKKRDEAYSVLMEFGIANEAVTYTRGRI